jgi:predicted acylesterase/phospholipase RssA
LLVDGGLTENRPLAKAIDLGATEIELFSCSADEPPRAANPGNKIGLAFRCLNAQALEVARDDVKVCMNYNSVPGRRTVAVTHHIPVRNVLGALDFSKIREGYKAARHYASLADK